MTESLALVLLIGAVCALVWLAAAFARYRATYRYDADDLAAARRDASRRSRSVVGGKAAEQLAPLAPAFCDRFDPSEARFLGSPVDYVVFDGIATGELRELVLVEVKTGRSRLNEHEREVERAVADGRVAFEVMRLG